nr:MAG TPA: hypothetical protein [Caudoviricetes sp.]
MSINISKNIFYFLEILVVSYMEKWYYTVIDKTEVNLR